MQTRRSKHFRRVILIQLKRAKHVITKPDTIKLQPQNLKRMNIKGSWSRDDHLLFKNAKVGDVAEIRIPTTSAVAEKLTLHTTMSYDFGMLRFSINGNTAGEVADHYSKTPVPSKPIALGSFAPVDGGYLLRVEVTGENPKSQGALFGIDCITLASNGE